MDYAVHGLCSSWTMCSWTMQFMCYIVREQLRSWTMQFMCCIVREQLYSWTMQFMNYAVHGDKTSDFVGGFSYT